MRSEKEMMELILSFAQKDDRIRVCRNGRFPYQYSHS